MTCTMHRYALSFSQQTDFEKLARWCNKMYSSMTNPYCPVYNSLNILANKMYSSMSNPFIFLPKGQCLSVCLFSVIASKFQNKVYWNMSNRSYFPTGGIESTSCLSDSICLSVCLSVITSTFPLYQDVLKYVIHLFLPRGWNFTVTTC